MSTTSSVGPGRYSPHPPKHYGADIFGIFQKDQAAWDLAYLSWDWEGRGVIRDLYFSTHILRTLQVPVGAGLTARACMNNIPPRAVYLFLGLPHLRATPMFQTYGQVWADTLQWRARAWHEPHHPRLDAPVNDFTSAMEVIRKL